MDAIKNCAMCSELFTDGVNCTVCNLDLHYQCAGITEAGYRKLGDRKLTWRCLKCKQSTLSQPPSSPRIEPDSLMLREIRNEIKSLSEKLAPLITLKDEIMELKAEIVGLRASLNDADKAMGEYDVRLENMEERLVQMDGSRKQIVSLESRLEKFEQESNSSEQWARMNNLEIKGIPQSNNENLFQILSSIGSLIQYPTSKSQINYITRVPTRAKDHIKPIIICFVNRYVKEDFVAAARVAFKTRALTSDRMGMSGNHKIYINDHLTIYNKILLTKAKQAAKDANFQYIWVKHAKIHVRQTDTSHVIMITSEKELSKIV